MKRTVILSLGTLLSFACGDPVAVLELPADEPWGSVAERVEADAGRPSLDYANREYWGCSSETTDDVCDAAYTMARVDTDGTVTQINVTPAAEPEADCFYIYPTVDLTMGDDNHDDMEDLLLPRRVIELQAAPFSQACRVFAPYYRQAVFGNYALGADAAVPQFVRAFADVTAAFEHYLKTWNEGRPLVIMGHSQGAQMAQYLLHKYFDGATAVTAIEGSETSDKLRKRLVLAMPIGFNVFTKTGEVVGGSFSDLPLCQARDETGCILAYRSYPEGHKFYVPAAAGFEVDKVMAGLGYLHRPYEDWDDAMSCVNPAVGPVVAPADASSPTGKPLYDGDIRLLAGTRSTQILLTETGTPNRTLVPGRYTATCRHDTIAGNYLGIGFHNPQGVVDQRGDPSGINASAAKSALGLHLQDFHLPMGDLIEQVRVKVGAFR